LEIEIKFGTSNMDFHTVTKFLSEVYWSQGITFEEVKMASENSTITAGAFLPEGRQVGFLRVVSDKIRFAYIMDVVVDPEFRKMGIAQKMIKSILESEEMKYVYQWLLRTRDAHGVYEKAGFKLIDAPEEWMILRKDRGDRSKFNKTIP
jgi:ribosomal protein S18 acetylase RimI-like enzyme